MSYIRKELQYLKRSFSFKKHNFLALAYDALLFFMILGIGYFFFKLILNMAFSSRPLIRFSNNELFQIYTSIIFGTILFVFIASGIYSLFKYLIWNNLLEQEFHKKGFVKYYFINVLLFIFLIILQALFVLEFHFHGLVVAVYLGIFFSHFNSFFQLHYIKHKSFKKAFTTAIKNGLKIHEFIFVYLTVAILVYIYLFIYSIGNQVLLFSLIPVLIIIMIFWLRNYFSKRHEF